MHKDGRAALTEGSHLLGRHPRSVVLIDSATVSRLHARITVVGGEATIADLGSRNGTHVGRVRVCAPMPLRDGDAIVIGGVTLEFRTADLRDPTDELPRH